MLESEVFRVVIREIVPENLENELRQRIIEAIRFFEEAFKSNFIRDSVLNFNSTSNGFNNTYNLGLNNQEIYYKLINAVEIEGNVEREIADLFLVILPENSPDGRTIGFVNNNSRYINTYKQFLLSLPFAELAGHFAHEWSHLLGFNHPLDTGTNGAYLSQTVPYALKNMVETYVIQRQHDFMLT